MGLDLLDVLVPAVVTILLVPLVAFLFDRRAAQAQGAFEVRRDFYEHIFKALTAYYEHVHYLPPNVRSGQPPTDPNKAVLSEDLAFKMNLHGSPVLLAYVQELLAALDESKGQSWHRVEMKHQMELADDPAEKERLARLMFEHDNRKLKDDAWARECLERVRQRMRWELYGWRRSNAYLRLRLRGTAKRIASNRTDFFTGGVDRSQ
jgi:hypothetical protein